LSTLIAYVSKHGTVKKCVERIAHSLSGKVDQFDLQKNPKIDLAGYDTVVIGGSIHAGRIQKQIKRFCEEKQDHLKQKRLGLFICCMDEGEKAQQQFKNSYPDRLINTAVAKGLFGGEFLFDRMNFLEKFIIKKIAKIDSSVSKLKEDNIAKFIAEVESAK